MKPEQTLLDQSTLNWPYDFYQQLRAEAPVYFDKALNAWLISRYEDIRQAAALDPTLSSFLGYSQGIAPPWAEELADMMFREGYGPYNLAESVKADPPHQARRRALLNQALSPRNVAAMGEEISRIASSLVEKLAGGSEVDLLAHYATPIPIMAMCRLMHFPLDRMDEMSSWADSVAASVAIDIDKDTAMEHGRNICELQKFIVNAIDERRENPGEDLISQMVHVRIDDDESPQLSQEELLAMGVALVAGGLDTTRNGIAWGCYHLATQPRTFRQLKHAEDQDRLLDRFIDESLRLQTVVSHVPRYATEDCVIGGATIPKGDTVFLCWGAGNTDEDVFPKAHKLDLERRNAGRHLAFGNGIHFCAGFRLAKLEMKHAFKALLARLDSLELICTREDLPMDAHMALRGPAAVPVRYTLSPQ